MYNCVRSSSLDQKKAGILLIVCLAETHAANIIRYANYLLKMLNTGGMDEETVRMASKALSFLIAVSLQRMDSLTGQNDWFSQQKAKNHEKFDD